MLKDRHTDKHDEAICMYLRRIQKKMHTFSSMISYMYIKMHGSENVKYHEANVCFSQFCENVYMSVQQCMVLRCISGHSHVSQLQ